MSAKTDAGDRALDDALFPALRFYTDELRDLRGMREGLSELLKDVTRWLVEEGPNPNLRATHCRLRILLASPVVVEGDKP